MKRAIRAEAAAGCPWWPDCQGCPDAGQVVAGEIVEQADREAIIVHAVKEFGKIDIRVNNAARPMTRESIDEISQQSTEPAVGVKGPESLRG